MPNRVWLTAFGINKYRNTANLRFCVNDANIFADLVAERFPGAQREVFASEDDPPDTEFGNLALEDVASLGYGADDLVIVYFAGHGYEVSGSDQLMFTNSRVEDASSCLATTEVISALRSSGAGIAIAVIDACRIRIARGSDIFGEKTLEEARRNDVMVFFGCSPRETCQEAAELEPGHGVFTYHVVQHLASEMIWTPSSIDRDVRRRVQATCRDYQLSQQTPLVVAALRDGDLDVCTGRHVLARSIPNRCIVLAGPSNAGKTSIGRSLAAELGFVHVEMSDYAYARYRIAVEGGYNRSIQEFMDDVVWRDGDFAVIAQDLLGTARGEAGLVISGPRRPEELEHLRSQRWDVLQYFVYSNSTERFRRLVRSSPNNMFGSNREDFIRRDMREYAWGVASIGALRETVYLMNEGNLEEVLTSVKARREIQELAT